MLGQLPRGFEISVENRLEGLGEDAGLPISLELMPVDPHDHR